MGQQFSTTSVLVWDETTRRFVGFRRPDGSIDYFPTWIDANTVQRPDGTPAVMTGDPDFSLITGSPGANAQLAPFISRVGSLPSNADLADRSKHTGDMPAANARMDDGMTVQAAIQQLRLQVATQASAPSITTDPTISDTTPAVNQTLTFTPGSVTDAAGRTSTAYYRVNIPGEPEGTFSTSTTYVVPAIAYAKGISVTQRQVDDAIPTLFAERTSAVTTAVSGTPPTNSVAPSWSPAGPVDVGTELTLDVESWTGAAYWIVQLTADSVPFGDPITITSPATTTNYTPITGQEGKAIGATVRGYSSLNVPSDSAIASSNTVTVNGAADVEWTVDPALADTVYIDTPNVGTAGTVTGAAINATRNYSFLYIRNGIETYFRTGNTIPTITPQSSVGVLVGDTIYMEEIVTITATGQTRTRRSAGEVVQAQPATFAVNLTSAGQAGYSWIQSQAISQTTVATAGGGTAPYQITASSLPTGVTASISGSNINLTGTPTALAAAGTAASVTVGDSGGATPIQVSFTYQVSAQSGVTALEAIPYTFMSAAISGDNSQYNGVTPKTYNGIIVLGPNGDGRNLHRAVQGAPSISGGVRNEMLAISTAQLNGQRVGKFIPGTPCWLTHEIEFTIPGEIPAATSAYDTWLSAQSHTPLSGDTQPGLAHFVTRQGGTLTGYWRVAGSAASPSGGNHTTQTPQPSAFGSQTMTGATKYRSILRVVFGGYNGHQARIDIWVRNGSASAWTQLVTNYNASGYPIGHNPGTASGWESFLEYWRTGMYKWTSSTFVNSPVSCVLRRPHFGYGDDLFDECAVVFES